MTLISIKAVQCCAFTAVTPKLHCACVLYFALPPALLLRIACPCCDEMRYGRLYHRAAWLMCDSEMCPVMLWPDALMAIQTPSADASQLRQMRKCMHEPSAESVWSKRQRPGGESTNTSPIQVVRHRTATATAN